MKEIEIIKIEDCFDSCFILPKRIYYKEEGVEKTWDVIQVHDSVSVLIFDVSKQAMIFVKQVRPALFIQDNVRASYELCAGIVDKQKSIEEIASEEVLEECGYKIDPSKLQFISLFYSSVGFAATKQYLFYAEVDSSMKVGEGGGIDTENIEVVEIPIHEVKDFIYQPNYAKTSGLMFAVLWFLYEKQKNVILS